MYNHCSCICTTVVAMYLLNSHIPNVIKRPLQNNEISLHYYRYALLYILNGVLFWFDLHSADNIWAHNVNVCTAIFRNNSTKLLSTKMVLPAIFRGIYNCTCSILQQACMTKCCDKCSSGASCDFRPAEVATRFGSNKWPYSDSNSLAFYNIRPSSLVLMTLKERGGRKR